MPELPEVETTCRGITPHALQQTISGVKIRNHNLRWPIPKNLPELLANHQIKRIYRRAKYILLAFDHGHLIIHLGMSGSLRVMPVDAQPEKHDHIDIALNGQCLRFNDPRRFGCVLFTDEPVDSHPLIAHLGPEPLSDAFCGAYLFKRTRKRNAPIKTFIMDGRIVVGVGNIYANEALFKAGVHPLKAAGKISKMQCDALANAIKEVLAYAIQRGGTTLRDFVGGDGKPGYFAQELKVYGRGALPCSLCGKPLTEKPVGQRSTVYCTRCQK